MRVVEVEATRARFADVLGEMREWLDRNARPLVRFETESRGADIIAVKVQFEIDILAEGFRVAFGGSYAD